MTTPKFEEIRTKAIENYHMENKHLEAITPTDSELKESHYWNEARDSLMRNEDFEYVSHIESEARRLGLLDQKEYVDTTNYVKKQIWFDLKEQRRTNTLISGSNQCGKSRLAMFLAHILRENGFNVICFDNAGTWKDLSDIPNYRLVSSANTKISLSRNMILDMSLLKPSRQRKLVNQWLEYLWLSAVNASEKVWQIVILEESELYCRNVRGELAENIYRIMCAGANQKLRIIAITPCMSIIDPLYIRLCGQRFHFKLSVEENSIRKFRRYYGGDNARIVQHLHVGYCLYYLNGKLKVMNIPLWQKSIKVIAK